MTATVTISSVLGQDYLGLSKNEIIQEFNEHVDSTYSISFSETIVGLNKFWIPKDTVTYFDTIANLKVLIDGFEKIEIDYFFDPFDNRCDSIVINYYCSECVDTNITKLMDKERRDWKQLDTNTYISPDWLWKFKSKIRKTVIVPKMDVRRTQQRDVCATIYLYGHEINRKQWKELKK